MKKEVIFQAWKSDFNFPWFFYGFLFFFYKKNLQTYNFDKYDKLPYIHMTQHI